ncbi:DEAD/DEAH box helicase [Rhizobium leucaenae]|uniref:DEAD/DEAH box helicase n=1 Tax=Rhizobium leucaenae TaxID=29450 RepID=UPI00040E0B51|nr:DEAD/DEAH box helicase [Rhizobium leucaenae]
MLQLRDYQRAAIDELYKYWAEGGGNGLIVLPTGAGKALVISKIIEELIADYPDIRILNITHSKTLVAQNFKEFIGLSPFAPAGIYSAGLGRRDARAQVLFCGIQSVANKTDQLGDIDLVIVDEAHAISRNADTLYGKFFAGVKARNPDSRVCGLTATDYRTDSGRLTEGEGKLFDDVVYEIGIGELIEQGYLSQISTKSVNSVIDLKGMHTRAGEYVPGDVSNAADKIIVDGVAEDIAKGGNRRAAMFFCVSQENAEKVCREVRRHGKTCELLTSQNPGEHDRIIADFRSGKVWGLVSVNMLTTGANYPFVDMISIYRSTKSAGLIVQIIGRVTRLCEGKADGLVLDHGNNLSRFGPIDLIRPKPPGSGDGTPPQKICPTDKKDANGNFGCDEILLISVMKCTCCGYEFPPNEEEKLTARAADAPVLSTEKPWYPVSQRTFRHHPGKIGADGKQKPDSIKCTYLVGLKSINEWHCCEHDGFPKSKAQRWWLLHGGQRPMPKTVLEWLSRQHELLSTEEVQLDYSRNPKFPDVMAHRVGAANDNTPEAANDNKHTLVQDWEIDDFVPF